jgi:osmotically-inducible protein OsmY
VKIFAEPYQKVINDRPYEPSNKSTVEKIHVTYPGPYQWLDEDIFRIASNALKSKVSVPTERLKVRMLDGVVTLSGQIDWEYQKFAAGEVIRYLTGVASVDNKITVKLKVKK